MAVSAGTAYVQIVGDLSPLNKQLATAFAPGKLGRLGKTAGVALGAGLVAAGVGKGLFDIGKTFDEAFDIIAVRTGKTGKALDGLKADFKDVFKSIPTDSKTAAQAVGFLNSRLGLTGKPLQRLSRQMLELSRITGTDLQTNMEHVTQAFKDFEISAKDQGPALDRLFRVTRLTGTNISDIASLVHRFGSPLRQLGFDFDHTAVMFAKFQAAGVNVRTAIPGLKIALASFAAAGKDPAKSLQEMFLRIKDANSATEAYRLQFGKLGNVFKIFGKRAGADLVEAIQQGRFNFRDLVKQIRDGGPTIEDTARNTNDLAENMKTLKNRVEVLLEPLGTKLFKALGDASGALVKFTAGGKEGAGIRQDLAKTLGLDKIDLSGLTTSLRSSFASIKSIVQSDLVQFLGRTFGAGLFGTFKKQVAGLAQVFRGMANVISGTLKLIDDLIHLRLGKAFKDLGQIFHGGVQIAVGALRELTAPVREIMATVGRALLSPLRSAWRAVRNAFSSGVGAALNVLRDMVSKAADLGAQIGRAIVRGLKGALKGAGSAIVSSLKFAGDFAKAIAQKIANLLNDAIPNSIGPINLPDNPIKFAKGGRVRDQRMALVGEQGPELVSLPVGSYVHKNSDSKRMAKQMGIPGFAKGGLITGRGVEATRRRQYERIRDRLFAHWRDNAGGGVEVPDMDGGPGSGTISPTQARWLWGWKPNDGRKPPFHPNFIKIWDKGKDFKRPYVFVPPPRSGDGPGTRGVHAASGGLTGPFGSGAGFVPITELAKTFGLHASAGRTNHKRLTTTGNVSDHSWGGAVDYSNGTLTPGEDRFAAFWKKHKELIKQLIWRNRVQIGEALGASVPDHEDHVHLALKRAFAFDASAVESAIGSGKGDFGKPKRAALPRHLSLGQYVTLAQQAGFPDPALAAAVFYAESKGNIHAIGDGGTSFGAAQIHWPDHKKYDKDKLRDDARYNFKAAAEISGRGRNFQPWTQYRNKAYKGFLGAKAKALPKGQFVQSGSYADYIQSKIDLADWHGNVGQELKWIAKGLFYWRKVMRRNNLGSERWRTAFENVKSLVEARKPLRKKGPKAAQLEGIGDLKSSVTPQQPYRLGYFQKLLTDADLAISRASLTETYDANGNLVLSSLNDDEAAADRKRAIWQQIYDLTAGFDLQRKIPGRGGKLFNVRDHISGTPAQQIAAATELKSARDALRSIQEEKKSEADSGNAGVTTSPSDAIKAFLESFRELMKGFASNIKPLPSFEGGGMVPGPVGQPLTATVHGGELVVDPKTGKLHVEVRQPEDSRTKKVVLYENNGPVTFVQPETQDIHAWSRAQLHELRAAS